MLTVEDVDNIFDKVTNFGPSTIVKELLDNQYFLEKISKKKLMWALQHHYVIDILNKEPSHWNLVEKDGSNVLHVLLSYQYILDLIDSETALYILQNTMRHANSQSIAVIFDNQTLLGKIDKETVGKRASYIGFIEDDNIIRQLL